MNSIFRSLNKTFLTSPRFVALRRPGLKTITKSILASILGRYTDYSISPRARIDVTIGPLTAAALAALAAPQRGRGTTTRPIEVSASYQHRYPAAAKSSIPVNAAADSVDNFLAQRKSHLKFARALIASKGIGEEAALQKTIQILRLSPEQALQLEDALVRYGLNHDIDRAVDETRTQAGITGLDAIEVIKIGHRSSQAATALSGAAPTIVSSNLAPAVSAMTSRARQVVVQNDPVSVKFNQKAQSSTQIVPEILAPTSSRRLDAVLSNPSFLPGTGALAIRQVFASTGQADSVWKDMRGGTACTFISLENLKAFKVSKDGQVSPQQMDDAMARGVARRAEFAERFVSDSDKNLTPVSEPLILKEGYEHLEIPEIPDHPLYGRLITASQVDIVAKAIVRSGKNVVVTVKDSTIAIGNHNGQITVFDSHGAYDVNQPSSGSGVGYGVTFGNRDEATVFLLAKFRNYVANLDKSLLNSVVEVFVEK